MSDDIDSLKQSEKEKISDWEMDFAPELDVAQIKAEEKAIPAKDKSETWPIWVAFMLIALVLLAFSGFNMGFGWWWFFIFLGPWIWGKGGCGRHRR
jgi:hypothetical protein